MSGYVLTWNPELWPWAEFADDDVKLRAEGFLDARWSTGNTKRIEPGDRIFLLRQSSERGLIGSGTALTKVFEEQHWNDPQSTGNYIRVRFDQLVTPDRRLPIEDLATLTPDFPWNRVQASGFSIDSDQCRMVNDAWKRHLSMLGIPRNVPFTIGSKYTRSDIYRILGIPEEQQGGDWDTGYHRHLGDWYLFVAVGTSGRTGHDYANHWEDDDLVWRGKTNSQLKHPSIQSLLDPQNKVYIFTREQDRSPFTFEGLGTAKTHEDTVPVSIRWSFPQNPTPWNPTEVAATVQYKEGAVRSVLVNAYERNRNARNACIARYGTQCIVCGFDFEKVYGAIGEGFIHVHHLRELSSIGQEYEVDPVADLRPVCANCHAMLHRTVPVMSINQLKIHIWSLRT